MIYVNKLKKKNKKKKQKYVFYKGHAVEILNQLSFGNKYVQSTKWKVLLQ